MTLNSTEAFRSNGMLLPVKVLVVDPDQDGCELLHAALEPYQMQIHSAHSVTQALSVLRQVRPDIVIIELVLPEAG